jgi:uncharacterized protein (TIGR03435 family)
MTRFAILALSVAAALSAQPLPSFDVASVKPNKSDEPPSSNFPLGPGDVYTPNGGHFTATDFPLLSYIVFAYKISGEQTQSLSSQLPGWVSSEKFDIIARTDGDPAKDKKDQMRLMVRTLLAHRFGMVAHYETRQVPAFGLLLLKPGNLGPQLRPHPANGSCSTDYETPPPQDLSGYPALCGALFAMPPGVPGRRKVAARNVTMDFIANSLARVGKLGRPVIDRTELSGTFDVALEWVPELDVPSSSAGGPSQTCQGRR